MNSHRHIFTPIRPLSDKDLLRDWWHHVLRSYGRLSCYGIFLLLPSDKEAIQYLKVYGKELDLISGKDCLILALTDIEFKRYGWDNEQLSLAVDEFTNEGHSLQIAGLMDILCDQFPALILFKDIRSSEYILISLKNLDVEQIATLLRSTFASIHKAAKDGENFLEVLNAQQNKEARERKSKNLADTFGKLINKTLETVLETWVKTLLK